MPRPFNVGIIGLGGMGRQMATAMNEHPHFQVVRAWDPLSDACALAQKVLPHAEIGLTPSNVIDDPSVDLCYIASPPASHTRYVFDAIQHGKALLCEKPLGVDLGESRKVVATAMKRDVPNAMNFNHGTHQGADWLADQINQGCLGAISGVSIHLHVPIWPRPFQEDAMWLTQRDQGGFTREMLSHWLYLTRKLLGDGGLVWAKTTYPDDGISAETAVQASLDFSGIPVQIAATTGGIGPVGVEYTVWAERASYRFKSGGAFLSWDGVGDVWSPVALEDDGLGGGDQRTLNVLAQVLDGELGRLPTLADGLAVQEFIKGILASE